MRKISFGAILLLLVLAITHRQLTHRQLTHRQLTHRQLTPREHSFALAADAKWTSAREINDLKVDKKGALWAATGGGVLRLQNGAWMKCSDGLPSNDVNGLRVQGDEIFAFTARDTALWQNGQWKQANQALFCVPQNVLWQGKKIYVLQNSLKMGSGTNARIIPLPKASGTHMSAILSRSGVLRAAMFGDGIWEWNGKIWTKPDLKLPDAAREITALAQSKDGKTVWVGTRREGVWEYSDNGWKQHLQPDEPFAHNIQFLQKFGGALYASTLEDGLIIRDAKGWRHLDKNTLSSNAPRQLVVFQNKLYVRHSNEVVDCFDGKNWAKNVFPTLPRKQIISIAADAKNLYLGQWGGWSEWDGKNFAHHLKIPELQIVPLMQIFPDGKIIWLGTENRGLFEWDAVGQKLRHHDERDGLPDDWITSLAHDGSTLLTGTFKGGVAWLDEKSATKKPRWQTALKGSGITSIAMERAGSTLIGTHFGLYHRDEKGNFSPLNNFLQGDEQEIQALLWTDEGLWIGTRSSLLFRTNKTLKQYFEAL